MTKKETIIVDNNTRLDSAALSIQEGGIVAFPTETVYGLGANAYDPNAINKIFEAKGRPNDNPLIVHISDLDMFDELTCDVPAFAHKLIDEFWPGPLTLVLKKSDKVPTEVTAGLDTVGIRMPSHPVALELISLSKRPIAAPSANLSGKPSPTRVEDVIADLNGRVDYIIEDTPSQVGIESTVLDCTVFPPVILRPGYVTADDIKDVIGEAENHSSVDSSVKADSVPKSPGVKYKHYAPNADFWLFDGNPLFVTRGINAFATIAAIENKKVGILATDQTYQLYNSKLFEVVSLGNRNDSISITHNLFSALRDMDNKKIDLILGETINDTQLSPAIMNRLTKSSGGKLQAVPDYPFSVLFVSASSSDFADEALALMEQRCADTDCDYIECYNSYNPSEEELSTASLILTDSMATLKRLAEKQPICLSKSYTIADFSKSFDNDLYSQIKKVYNILRHAYM